jgi:hypothetical protein
VLSIDLDIGNVVFENGWDVDLSSGSQWMSMGDGGISGDGPKDRKVRQPAGWRESAHLRESALGEDTGQRVNFSLHARNSGDGGEERGRGEAESEGGMRERLTSTGRSFHRHRLRR